MKAPTIGIAFGILAALVIGRVRAEDIKVNCNDVRAVVKMIGRQEALRLAKEAGASPVKIAEAERCLRAK